jgi:peptidoglycan/xylan/chitin deacetylase (PgdA/CDA1 family)
VTALPPGGDRPPIPLPRPGPPRVVSDLPPTAGPAIALTVDDGFDRETVRAYVQFATDSGVALTFNPNARYAEEWAPHARTLAPLIASGQVQIGNHTFSHADLVRLPADGVRTEIERNEDWIQKTFGITSRPWLRPPYGHHDAEVDRVAADVGFTHVALWNASIGDSSPLTQRELLARMRQHVRAGTILLGHANYPAVTHVYDQLVELIRERGLTPRTLDQLFGTSRATG